MPVFERMKTFPYYHIAKWLMNSKSLVGEVKCKSKFLESHVVGGRVPSTDDSLMPIMRVSWKVKW